MSSRRRWWLLSIAAAIAVVALAVRLGMVLRGAGLGGVRAYDDGVYFSASTSLAWGRMPYQDFVLLHPPGIVLALLPFAELGRVIGNAHAFELARLGFMGLGALNAALVVAATRRLGLVAATAAGLFYALWPAVALAETTTRLEPLLNTGILAAVALLVDPERIRSRGIQVLAGVALAVALATKIWAVVPITGVLLWSRWLLRRRIADGVGPDRGAWWRVVGWTGVSAAVIYLPFWLPAPWAMTRMVVLDQLGRPRNPASPLARLSVILGAPSPGSLAAGDPRTWTTVAVLIALAALAVAGRRGHHLGRFAVGLVLVQLVVLLASPPFFDFYVAYVAPATAIVVGAGVAGLGDVVRSARASRAIAGPPRAVLAGGVVVLGVALLPLAVVDARSRIGMPLADAKLRPLLATSGCVTSDKPGLLLLLDVLNRDLARDCPVMVDVTGAAIDTERQGREGVPVPRMDNSVWQRSLRRYLFSGEVMLLGRSGVDGLSLGTRQALSRLPALHREPGVQVYAVPSARRTTTAEAALDDQIHPDPQLPF